MENGTLMKSRGIRTAHKTERAPSTGATLPANTWRMHAHAACCTYSTARYRFQYQCPQSRNSLFRRWDYRDHLGPGPSCVLERFLDPCLFLLGYSGLLFRHSSLLPGDRALRQKHLPRIEKERSIASVHVRQQKEAENGSPGRVPAADVVNLSSCHTVILSLTKSKVERRDSWMAALHNHGGER